MRAYQLIPEYEQGSPESEEIQRVLQRAGYQQLGTGEDAIAWTRKDGPVVKILMPTSPGRRRRALDSFLMFYQLTQKHPSPHWPRFYEMQDERGRMSHFADFRMGDKTYTQIALERLLPLDLLEQAMINSMGAAVTEPGIGYKTWLRDWFMQDYDIPQSWLEENDRLRQLPGLYQAMRRAHAVMRRSGNASQRYVFDIHGDNVMRRRDGTYVITDPYIHW